MQPANTATDNLPIQRRDLIALQAHPGWALLKLRLEDQLEWAVENALTVSGPRYRRREARIKHAIISEILALPAEIVAAIEEQMSQRNKEDPDVPFFGTIAP